MHTLRIVSHRYYRTFYWCSHAQWSSHRSKGSHYAIVHVSLSYLLQLKTEKTNLLRLSTVNHQIFVCTTCTCTLPTYLLQRFGCLNFTHPAVFLSVRIEFTQHSHSNINSSLNRIYISIREKCLVSTIYHEQFWFVLSVIVERVITKSYLYIHPELDRSQHKWPASHITMLCIWKREGFAINPLSNILGELCPTMMQPRHWPGGWWNLILYIRIR